MVLLMEWVQEKLVCVCSVWTQPLQTAYEGHTSRSVACFLSMLDQSLLENVDAELGVMEPDVFPTTSFLCGILLLSSSLHGLFSLDSKQ